MPVRRTRARSRTTISPHDIEALRGAIRDGWPWRFHIDPVYHPDPLNTELSILLAYITGVHPSCAVYLGGGDHPSRKTVKAVKAELQADIAEGEAKARQLGFKKKKRGYNF